ncbi:MAG: BREX system ATP-binding domain-containing protein, partial [Candidatus Binatia bacterium]
MQKESQFLFSSFRLDSTNECLWRGKKEIRIHPKAFTLLWYLVERSGQLVTKDILLEVIWPKVYVADTVLSVYISEIRKALGDDPKKPRFIETVHRRGYRFISPVTTRPEPVSTEPIVRNATTTIGSHPLVGRETEISFLQERLEETLQGRASVVFITGQAGIGKTRLVRELRDHARQRRCQWLEGQYNRAGSLPYQAWVEMVKEYLHQSEATSLQKLVGPYAEQLAKLVPEVAVKGKDASPEVRGNPEG